jgi:predicted dehydrogenase
VIVEKPMAIKYVDCVAMIDAAKRAGRLLTVFHNRRLDPSFVAVRDALASGRLGALVEARATWQNAPAWKQTSKTWRAYRETSGGLMYDWGSHLIDHVLHFAHASVTSVAGSLWCHAGADPALNQDHGQIDIRFASGVVGRVVVSDVDREPRNRYTVIGEDATLVDGWNFGPGIMKLYAGNTRDEFAVEEIAYDGDGGSGAGFYANLAAHYRDGVPAMVTAESAARVIRVLNAADESQARGGATVGFDEA